jgi:GNAT superfamily N-acetyltransferase
MDRLQIIDTDAETIGNYSFCGFKNIKQEGYRRKIDWLKQRFTEGLKFSLLYSEDQGAVGSIEYIPGEYTWRAIKADGYTVIHCIINIHPKNRKYGYGSLLVEKCIQDARKENRHGVAVVTSKGTWMAGSELFLKNGFELVDQCPPSFELLVKKFTSAPSPRFTGDWEKKLAQYGQGLTIITSDQCPYIAKNIGEIVETAEVEYGLNPKVVKLTDHTQAQNAPSPYGIFSLIYNGKLLVDHTISNKRFMNLMNKELSLFVIRTR